MARLADSIRASAADAFDPLAFERPDPDAAARLRVSLAIVVAIYMAIGVALLLVPARYVKGPENSQPILIELPSSVSSRGGSAPQAAPAPETTKEDPLDERAVPMPKPAQRTPRPKVRSDTDDVAAKLQPSTSAPLGTLPGAAAPTTQVLNFSAAAQERAREDWYARLSAHLDRFKHYPQAARRKGESGTVMLHFAVDREGKVIVGEIAESSGFPRLDAAALDMLRRAAPLPAMPDEMLDLQCDFVIAVDYGLN